MPNKDNISFFSNIMVEPHHRCNHYALILQTYDVTSVPFRELFFATQLLESTLIIKLAHGEFACREIDSKQSLYATVHYQLSYQWSGNNHMGSFDSNKHCLFSHLFYIAVINHISVIRPDVHRMIIKFNTAQSCYHMVVSHQTNHIACLWVRAMDPLPDT